MHNGDSLLGFSDTSHPILLHLYHLANSSFSEWCFLLCLFFPKGAELTRTWVETSSYFLSIVKFGICWASIFALKFFHFCQRTADDCGFQVFLHASICVWLVSRGRLEPLLSTMCWLNWCQPVCHCVCIVAVVEELLSHNTQCWYLLLISAPFKELTSLVKSHAPL